MRFKLVAVGKMKEPASRQWADEYLKRIRRHGKLEEVEVKNDAALASAVSGDVVVAMEVKGKALTSEQFARKVEQWSQRGKGNITFLIGGAEGIPKAVSDAAHEKLSLSTMTLPHRLARVFLFEQIYRAISILRGEPYARED